MRGDRVSSSSPSEIDQKLRDIQFPNPAKQTVRDTSRHDGVTGYGSTTQTEAER